MNIEPSKLIDNNLLLFYYFTMELSWRELTSVSPLFFQEENNLFDFQNAETKSNILMELAKSAKDDALRELLVNRSTYRFVNIDIRRLALGVLSMYFEYPLNDLSWGLQSKSPPLDILSAFPKYVKSFL